MTVIDQQQGPTSEDERLVADLLACANRLLALSKSARDRRLWRAYRARSMDAMLTARGVRDGRARLVILALGDEANQK